MYILTQDEMRIVPFGERDSIGIELGQKASDYGICALGDSHDIEMEYCLWLCNRGEKTIIGAFSTETAAKNAISRIFIAIDNDWRIMKIPKDDEV